MSSTTDAFARFLDLLVVSLDDHGLSGEALASRVHLSRFHFDRLVSAAAGEPPAALRRRILLERAAYQLVTTDRDVLDVALEAGYSSHEAFTRAFVRAYGQSPSRWRRKPTGFRIEAPSDVHFHPPRHLWVPAERKVTTMDLVIRMVEHYVWLTGEMLSRAERLSGDALDAPVEISVEGIDSDPTLRSLLSRLVGQLAMWDAAVSERPYDFEIEKGESVAGMRARLTVAGPAFLTDVRTIAAEGRLDETFVDADLRPAASVHVCGDDRPCPDVRRAPPDTGLRRSGGCRRHGPRQRRSDALGGRGRLTSAEVQRRALRK